MPGPLYYIAFSQKGFALAARLAGALGGEAARSGRPLTAAAWAAAHWQPGCGLVFVGAVGIAVRTIAPLLRSKAEDPAVVAVDECGCFAVAVAGGHLGGANALAGAVAVACGAQPVVTTATDRNRLFAVDSWAAAQRCALLDPGRIKAVSAALLAGQTVTVASVWPIAGTPPAGVRTVPFGRPADVCIGWRFGGCAPALRLAPRALVLGVGCRRGVTAAALEQALQGLLADGGWPVQAIAAAASIDLKKQEPGLLALCRAHGWPLITAGAAQLAAVPGQFAHSAFVQQVAGVDNVCERAAVLAAGGGPLLAPKRAAGGITLALAARRVALQWPAVAPNEEEQA